jgi:hypothetical protein
VKVASKTGQKRKISFYKVAVNGRLFKNKSRLSKSRRKAFFTFKWEAAVWLCGVR